MCSKYVSLSEAAQQGTEAAGLGRTMFKTSGRRGSSARRVYLESLESELQ